MGLEIIKSVYKRKTEEREKLRKVSLERIDCALKRLSEELHFEEAYIFGSVTAQYKFSEYSDIDIAFKGLAKDDLFYAVSFLSREIGRDVNAVRLEDLHFRDKVLREGIRWKKD